MVPTRVGVNTWTTFTFVCIQLALWTLPPEDTYARETVHFIQTRAAVQTGLGVTLVSLWICQIKLKCDMLTFVPVLIKTQCEIQSSSFLWMYSNSTYTGHDRSTVVCVTKKILLSGWVLFTLKLDYCRVKQTPPVKRTINYVCKHYIWRMKGNWITNMSCHSHTNITRNTHWKSLFKYWANFKFDF